MNEISVIISGNYGDSNKYRSMLTRLGESLCYAYGGGFARNYKFKDEPINKMRLSKIPSRTSRLIVEPFCRIVGKPRYYNYMSKVAMTDIMFSGKVAEDDSRIVFANPLLHRTVKSAKRKGKYVVVEAGNSEPRREHDRIMSEYQKFGINHRYIYGDERFRNSVLKSYELADKIITISRQSERTYIDGGCYPEKLHFIPMTGTDFPISEKSSDDDKQKAFISTGFHSFIKGTHRLLLAWRRAKIEKIPLIIVGTLCEDMQEFIKKNGPFDNVIYAGFQNNLSKFYGKYDGVGILMSLSEGAVRTTPEMMSCGFPMITSPDATCDIVKDGVNGFIINFDDEMALAERLVFFASNWEKVARMRDEVIQSVSHRSMTDFSMELGEYLLSMV